jgi:hypothetical protein
MAEELWINGTKVHEVGASVVSPGGNGIIAAVEMDFGTPDQETFLDARPLADGMVFRGTVTKGRSFKLRFKVTGVAGRGEGFDEWQALLGLLSADNGIVSYKVVRPDSAAADVERELLAIVTGEPAWKWVSGGGEDGIRSAGHLVVSIDCIAPFPWWRSVDPETEVINFSGSGTGNVNITRLGQMACGLEAKVTTAGNLANITLDDGVRTLTLTATFGGSAKGVDWYFADPTATVIDSGVVISIPSHLSLHSASTTITATTSDGGASGSHTVTIRYYPLWRSP